MNYIINQSRKSITEIITFFNCVTKSTLYCEEKSGVNYKNNQILRIPEKAKVLKQAGYTLRIYPEHNGKSYVWADQSGYEFVFGGKFAGVTRLAYVAYLEDCQSSPAPATETTIPDLLAEKNAEIAELTSLLEHERLNSAELEQCVVELKAVSKNHLALLMALDPIISDMRHAVHSRGIYGHDVSRWLKQLQAAFTPETPSPTAPVTLSASEIEWLAIHWHKEDLFRHDIFIFNESAASVPDSKLSKIDHNSTHFVYYVLLDEYKTTANLAAIAARHKELGF